MSSSIARRSVIVTLLSVLRMKCNRFYRRVIKKEEQEEEEEDPSILECRL